MKKIHLAVLLLCLLAASLLFHDFLSHPRGIWNEFLHDRNGHYGYGLDMAEAIEHGQPLQFLNQFEKGKIWPPFHGLLVMVTQILTGNDWRAAVLPSLTGWLLALLGAWYLAQRIAAPTGIGWAAGLVALLFTALSPGGRTYATDIMLESLGAGLTMLALACYARAVGNRDSVSRWRTLALVLTLLFFEKYNYWMIVALALAISEAGPLWAAIRSWRPAGIDWKKVVRAQSRHPLNWLLFVLLALVLYIMHHGPSDFHIAGRDLSLYPPNNLITVAYVVFFLRVALVLRRTKWQPAETWQRMIWRWHVLPLSVSFLLPQRLGIFIHYLGFANSGDAPTHTLPGTAVFYWDAFISYYNAAPWLGFLAFGLACVALTQFRTFEAGGRAVLICMLLGMALDIIHPNNKPRFLHSWLPTLWTAAGIGAAILPGKMRIPRKLSGLAAGIGIAALAIAGGRAAWMLPHTAASAVPMSDLDMSDAWLAAVEGCPKVAFFSTQPARSFMAWTFLNRRGIREDFEWPQWQDAASPDELREGSNRWLAQTSADAVVFLDVPPQSPRFSAVTAREGVRGQIATLMAGQTKFHQALHFDLPNQVYRITVWRITPK